MFYEAESVGVEKQAVFYVKIHIHESWIGMHFNFIVGTHKGVLHCHSH